MITECQKCGGAHPQWDCRAKPAVIAAYQRDRLKAGAKLAEAEAVMGPVATLVTVAAKLYAPKGQCGFCDARRDYAAAGMARSRAKKRGGS